MHTNSDFVLCVGEIILLKSSLLPGDEGSENIADNQQSSSEIPNQEWGPAAVSGGQEEHHERAPSPSSEETSPRDPSYQSAEEEPETPDGVEYQDSGRSRTTMDLMALISHRPKDEECLSDPPPTVPDVSTNRLSDLCHLQQTLENSRGAEDESDESPEAVEAAYAECFITEENTNISISFTAAASSAEEQEDVQSSQETELSDETDVCVHQGI